MARYIPLLLAIFSLVTPIAMAGELGVDIRFSNHEVEVIRAYFREQSTPTHPGGKKSKGLPPGIAKNLQRGKTLPPGIAKQALPAELLTRLPPAPAGYERIELAGKVLLVEIATQVIHDVLSDVLLD